MSLPRNYYRVDVITNVETLTTFLVQAVSERTAIQRVFDERPNLKYPSIKVRQLNFDGVYLG